MVFLSSPRCARYKWWHADESTALKAKPGKPSSREVEPELAAPPPQQLIKDEDYYLERGRMVFTAEFLKQRGSCCESGCRHCPYGFGPEGLRKKLEAEKIRQRG